MEGTNMDTIQIDHPNTRMIAHRGLSGLERENTNAAFVAAGNRSYFGVETDVHKTADGKFVILHDETTLRVSDGRYSVNVEEEPLASVETIRLPDLDGEVRSDLSIPTMGEYVRICKKYGKICVLELKNPMEQADIAAIIAQIRELCYLEQVIFISFSLENCRIVRALLPEQRVQWLTSRVIDKEVVDALVENRLDLDTDYKYLSESVVRDLHDRGIAVNCWTCNDPEDGRKLAAMNVDFITTNILE